MLHFFSMRKKVFANCQLSRPLFIGSPLLQRSKNSRWICVLIEFEWLGRVENKLARRRLGAAGIEKALLEGEDTDVMEKVLSSSPLGILDFREAGILDLI